MDMKNLIKMAEAFVDLSESKGEIVKNNNELLANLGNFSNRILKFLVSAFKKVVPEYP